jgi:Fe-S cluster assembly protein SufD
MTKREMNAVLDKITIPTQLQEDFQALLNKTFAAEPLWLREKRSLAIDKFSKLGIPEKKNEEYKYTDVKKVFGQGKYIADHNEVHKIKFDIGKKFLDKNSIKLFFVNGWLYKDSTLSASLPKGVIVGNMASELFVSQELIKKNLGSAESDSWTSSLNNAFWTDGAFIYVPKGIALQTNIEIIHLSTGKNELLVSPRHLIVAEENAEVNIIEQNFSLDVEKQVIVNSVTEILTEKNAKVKYYKIQSGIGNTFHLHNTYVVQKQQSVFDTGTFTLDSEWVRNNLNIQLNGEHCETHLNGLFITNGTEHVDNHTQVYHNQPNCQSNQLYKGILNDKSVGVFNGKIYVARDAQKTNAYQSSKNILLSDDATINTKPQLEIYADDVKCSHGSSTGQIDEDALFYLRSRGLSVDSAKNLLMYAFAKDVVNTVRVEVLKEYINRLVEGNLNSK